MNKSLLSFDSVSAVEAFLAMFKPAAISETGKGNAVERMSSLMKALGNPQKKLKIIHIAGTSGKSSTAYYIASMLEANDRKVGLSVSPHIDSITERFQVNLNPIKEIDFCQYMSDFLGIIEDSNLQPTYFELLTAFAFWYFDKTNVDFAVIETGIGGLYDCTNITKRADKVCVITDIGLDHTQLLGKNISDIAKQKAGIMHDLNTAFVYKQEQFIMNAFYQRAKAVGARLFELEQSSLLDKYELITEKLPLYQERNWLLAREVSEYVSKVSHFDLDDSAIKKSINLTIPGRMDIMRVRRKQVILDGAHNEQKMEAFVRSFQQKFPNKKVPVLISLKNDKKSVGILRCLRRISDTIIVTSFGEMEGLPARPKPVNELAEQALECGFRSIYIETTVSNALNKFYSTVENVCVITGSFYLVSLAKKHINKHIIRAIVAMDEKRGIANQLGIPWNIPSDQKYVSHITKGGSLLMGYNTYRELSNPLPNRRNIVLTNDKSKMRKGYETITSTNELMKNLPENLWIFGGASLYSDMLKYVDEIYITQIKRDYNCTKFFPEYVDEFDLTSESPEQNDKGVKFTYQVWRRKY